MVVVVSPSARFYAKSYNVWVFLILIMLQDNNFKIPFKSAIDGGQE